MSHLYYSASAGAFGSAGSLFGKLAGSSETYAWNSTSSYVLKGILLAVMVLFNTVGCTLYAKSLQMTKSSLEPTLISASVNYLFSAIAGYLVFGELTSALWWCGTFLVLSGIFVISWPHTKQKIS